MTNTELHRLLRQIASGSKPALAQFYQEMEKPVFRFIVSKLNDPVEASDILHEVFLDVWKAAGSFEGRSQVKTWVFGIAYRKTMDHFRKHSRVKVTDEIAERQDHCPEVLVFIAQAEEAQNLRECLQSLKEEHRTTIELAFYEDLSYHEIAAIMNVPEGTVKSRVFHAKKILLKRLSSRFNMGPA